MSERPARVRVTAGSGPHRSITHTRGIALPGTRVDEAEAVYARSLMRAQLRLALATIAGFLVVMITLALLVSLVAELEEIVVWSIPLSWWLHAFAFYPVIFVFAVLYRRGAAHNEERYRMLRERE